MGNADIHSGGFGKPCAVFQKSISGIAVQPSSIAFFLMSMELTNGQVPHA